MTRPRLMSIVLFSALVAGCGVRVSDHGSDVRVSGVSLVYTDWVVPAEGDWKKDAFECERDARDAVPNLFRLPGRRQVIAERCLTARGYVRR
jgi:hypothetical protein